MAANKIALITGGSRGLGKNMALSLAAKGTDVILTYNSKEDDALAVVNQIKQNGQNAAALQLNASDIAGYSDFFKKIKGVLSGSFGADHFDFLINNAGTGVYAPFVETTEAQFDEMLNVHFKAAFFLTQKALPLMNDGGRIINLSSGLARFSSPGYAAYGAMKGGIETLSRYMAKDLANGA